MTMILAYTGKMVNKVGFADPQPERVLVHPFLAGARKNTLGIPDKDKLGRDVKRCVAPGAMRPEPKVYGAKEQARTARRLAAQEQLA